MSGIIRNNPDAQFIWEPDDLQKQVRNKIESIVDESAPTVQSMLNTCADMCISKTFECVSGKIKENLGCIPGVSYAADYANTSAKKCMNEQAEKCIDENYPKIKEKIRATLVQSADSSINTTQKCYDSCFGK